METQDLPSGNGINFLIKDHQTVRQLFDRYKQSNSNEEKIQLVRIIIKELSLHASAEERYFYPMLTEKMGPQAQFMYQKNLLDDLITKQTLQFMENNIPTNDFDWRIFDRLMEKFIFTQLAHIEEEENVIFPFILPRLSIDELGALEDCLKYAKEHGPTHPHPLAPMDPERSKILHPITGELDKIMDSRLENPNAPLPASGQLLGNIHQTMLQQQQQNR
ncbi:hypothetical protein ABK040_001448 [Willaertia magna]